MQFCLLDLMSSHEHTLPEWAFLGHQITHNLHENKARVHENAG